MKTVVLQTYTGKGYLGHSRIVDSEDVSINRQIMAICMKSVKNWCDKNEYEYKLIKDIDLGWNYFTKRFSIKNKDLHNGAPLVHNEDREKDLCAQRHEVALKIDADYLVILDNDIFVEEDFKLPNVKVGLCVTPWGEFKTPDRKNYRVYERFDIFTQMYNCAYPQGGVQFISGKYIKHYNNWLVNSFKADKWPILWDGLEQSHIFEYSQQFPENINWLDHKYNCIPQRYTLKEIKESFLIHFCGPRKSTHIKFLEEEMLFKLFGEINANSLRKHWN
tara:strand:- start:40 stop:867 length:828 start_codon:yes stop_codon:yes gene_type:complete